MKSKEKNHSSSVSPEKVARLKGFTRMLALTHHRPFATDGFQYLFDNQLERKPAWTRTLTLHFWHVMTDAKMDLRTLLSTVGDVYKSRKNGKSTYPLVKWHNKISWYSYGSLYHLTVIRRRAIPKDILEWIDVSEIQRYIVYLSDNREELSKFPFNQDSWVRAIMTVFIRRIRRTVKSNPDYSIYVWITYHLTKSEFYLQIDETKSKRYSNSALRHLRSLPTEDELLCFLLLRYSSLVARQQSTLSIALADQSLKNGDYSFCHMESLSPTAFEQFSTLALACSNFFRKKGRLDKTLEIYKRLVARLIPFKNHLEIGIRYELIRVIYAISTDLIRLDRRAEALDYLEMGENFCSNCIDLLDVPHPPDLLFPKLFQCFFRYSRAVIDKEFSTSLDELENSVNLLNSLLPAEGKTPTEPIKQFRQLSRCNLLHWLANSYTAYQRCKPTIASLTAIQRVTGSDVEFFIETLRMRTQYIRALIANQELFSQIEFSEVKNLGDISDNAGFLTDCIRIACELKLHSPEFSIDPHTFMGDPLSAKLPDRANAELSAILNAYDASTVVSHSPTLAIKHATDALEKTLEGITLDSNELPRSCFYLINKVTSVLRQLASHNELPVGLLTNLEIIFNHIETARSQYGDTNDLVWIESGLCRAYRDASLFCLSLLRSAILSKSEELRVADFLSVSLDRSSLRWALSLITAEPDQDAVNAIPTDLRIQFEQLREELFQIGHAKNCSDSPLNPIPTEPMESSDLSRLGEPTLVPGDGEPVSSESLEVDVPSVKVKPNTFESSYRQYRRVVRKIQEVKPGFEPDSALRNIESPDNYFKFLPEELRLQIQPIDDCVLVNLKSSGTEDFRLVELASLSVLTNQCREFSEQLFAADFSPHRPAETSPDLHRVMNAIEELLAQLPSETSDCHLQLLIDSSLVSLPIHFWRSSKSGALILDEFTIHRTPSMLLKRAVSEKKSSTSKIVATAPERRLVFSQLEIIASWNSNSEVKRLSGSEANSESIFKESLDASVFHFCGHMISDTANAMNSHLACLGFSKLSLGECINSLRFRERPIVILNACRTASIPFSEQGAQTVHQGRSERSFENYLASEPLSFSTAFLIAGARAVIGTLWDVNDFIAAIFGWKFSKLMTQFTAAEAFSKTVKWLREEIPDSEYLLNTIWPAFREDYLSNSNASPSTLLRCEEILQQSSWSNRGGNPFANPKYWGAFVYFGYVSDKE